VRLFQFELPNIKKVLAQGPRSLRKDLLGRKINRADFRHILGKFAGLSHGHSSCALKSLKIDVIGTTIVFSGQFGVKKRVSDVLAPEILMPRSGTRIWCGELCAVIFIEIPHFE
jgi:hypothetical protein